MRVAVVGHVEWVHLARVDHVPVAGELVQASEWWQEAAGGAAIAAVQAHKLGAEVDFFTTVGDDELGRRAVQHFRSLGLRVHAVARGEQRHAFIQLDRDGERTIITMGERTVPAGADPLPWERLDSVDGVYFTGGDKDALAAARQARALVATPRAGDMLRRSGVKLDVLVRSGNDPGEMELGDDIDPPPHYIVSTGGKAGGQWVGEDHTTGGWKTAELPGPKGDSYGAGDSFAGGLTWGLAASLDLEAALQVAARCGAHKLAGRAGFDGQLTVDELN
jgi:ribokinase